MRISQLKKEYPDNPMLDIIEDEYRNPKLLDEIPLDELEITITDPEGDEILEITAEMKHFSSGKIGYHGYGTMVNPESGAEYQVSVLAILKGS